MDLIQVRQPAKSTDVSIVKLFLAVTIAVGLFSSCSFASSTQAPVPSAVISTSTPALATDIPPVSPAAADASEPIPSPEPAQTEPSTDPGTLPAAPGELSLTRYELEARLDYQAHTLEVRENVRYLNTTGETLPELVLAVESNNFPGVFSLQSVQWEGGQPVDGYTLEGTRLQLPLPRPVAPGERVDFSLVYTLDLPPIAQEAGEYRPNPFGYSGKQTNLVDWYPFVPPYSPEEGWLIHNVWYFGEHQVYDVADYDVRLEIQGENVIAAASAPAEADGEALHYRLEAGRTFVISASSEYQVVSQTVGTTTVYSYYLPYGEAGGYAALEHTAQALELYSSLLGPYPHPSLSVVEATFLDGMEYEGLYFLSYGFYNTYDYTPYNYLTIIAVHETAHQWWYGRVGNDQALEPWLDEAFCTYMERVYYQAYYPDQVDWWWQFRVGFYEPSGEVGGSIYDYRGFVPYRNAVYLRGAMFLEELRLQMGDEDFLALLKEYAQQHTGQLASSADFFSLLQSKGEEIPPGYFTGER